MAYSENRTMLHRWQTAWSLFVLLLSAGMLGCMRPEPNRETCQRIISLAPSTTEILFALGLGDRIVGVTRFCNYPDATRNIAKVGGYVDLNYEEIVSLRPDLTILLTSHHDAKVELEQLGIRTLSTPHETIADIHQTIQLIGRVCDRKDRADSLVAELTRRKLTVRRAVEDERAPCVLICVGRDTQSGQLSGMYIAGRHGLYDEMIELARGVNVYQDDAVAYPQVSAEGVLEMAPDVIVDIVSDTQSDATSRQEIVRQWNQLRTVPAVRNGRVHVVLGAHALHPGPRYVEFLEQLARLLHPDAFAEDAAYE